MVVLLGEKGPISPRAGARTPLEGACRDLRVDLVQPVAWTLADLQGLARPDRDCVEQALYFRDRRAAG